MANDQGTQSQSNPNDQFPNPKEEKGRDVVRAAASSLGFESLVIGHSQPGPSARR
jgi:hypothetical protein